MKVRVARMQAELAEIESRQHAVSTLDALAEIAGRPDAAQVWMRLDLGRQRAILKALLVVTVLPVGAGSLPVCSSSSSGTSSPSQASLPFQRAKAAMTNPATGSSQVPRWRYDHPHRVVTILLCDVHRQDLNGHERLKRGTIRDYVSGRLVQATPEALH